MLSMLSSARTTTRHVWRASRRRHRVQPALTCASVALSSDQNDSTPAFTDCVRDVDVLVVHIAGSEVSTEAATDLHARPSVWGQMAADAGVGTLVLSHLSANQKLEENVAHLRSTDGGPLIGGFPSIRGHITPG